MSATATEDKGPAPASPRGLIVFCDRNLRYEGGLKAWLLFGPYFLGAWILEVPIGLAHASSPKGLVPWLVFLVYLLVFPPAWGSALRFCRRRLTGIHKAT